MTVGEKIKMTRTAKSMTQKELGIKCGIDAANLRKYESGRQEPKLDTLIRIADGLGVSVDELIPEKYLPVKDETEYFINEMKNAMDLLQKEASVISTLKPESKPDPETVQEFQEAYRQDLIKHVHELALQKSGKGLTDIPILPSGMDYYTYKFELIKMFCSFLNEQGFDRLLAYLIDLTKIPEYTK